MFGKVITVSNNNSDERYSKVKMAEQIAADMNQDKRTWLLDAAATGNVNPKELLEAVLELEQQKQRGNLAALNGEWKLVWTSGTKQYQKLQNDFSASKQQPLGYSNIVQRIDVQIQQIVTEVHTPFGSLSVSGPFEYSDQKRIQFTFERLRLKIGRLPTLQLPLGKWAKGWLQTTYLDERLHIERGDRGGISVYIRTTDVSEITPTDFNG